MASVNFEKYKTAQAVKAVVKHCDKEQRQLTENHNNQDINKNMSCKNLQYSNTNYKSTCKRFDDRIAFLDTLENQNKRKDRVLCFGLEIPCPAEGLRTGPEATKGGAPQGAPPFVCAAGPVRPRFGLTARRGYAIVTNMHSKIV